jgi:Cu(I)/Ag(I) efflux system membrane fusion protein
MVKSLARPLRTLTLIRFVALAVLPSFACTSTNALAAPPVASAPLDSAKAEVMLADYEALRAALAADKLGQAPALAAKIAASAKAAGQKQMSSAALTIKTGQSADDTRRAFGELSKGLVALLVAHPKLAAGRHIFECPMAQGYQKWVQSAAKLENPYMGGRMLRCGSASKWSH